jgi:hypothetical protein
LVRASRRDGASSKENSLNSNAAREAPTYGRAVQSNVLYVTQIISNVGPFIRPSHLLTKYDKV